MTTTTAVVLIAAALVVVAAVAWWMREQRRRARLRSRFGPEYYRAVREMGPRKAERELASRAKHVGELTLRPLSPEDRGRFETAWRDVQAAFVDDPRQAILSADRLLGEVMQTIGYPMRDFDERIADLSVHHPYVVRTYRAAHEVAEKSGRGQATTEDLRNAMLLFRDLFADLLEGRETPRRAG